MGTWIVFITPIFLLLIVAEFAWSRWRLAKPSPQRDYYQFADSVSSLSLGLLSQLLSAVTSLLTVAAYTALYEWVSVWQAPDFWSTWYGYALALVFYDFCYYWQHRAGHEVACVWASHSVHHQSQYYNLSTALRQGSGMFLWAWIFFIPMALAGVPPQVFLVVALVDLVYQFWVHTELVGSLGWFDRVFCSPSNHRAHHAVNDLYLDRNYGGILMVWDHCFGTFQPEMPSEPCVYGTRSPLNSYNPIWAHFQVYAGLARTSWHMPRWRDKVRVWFKPPGWTPPAAPLATSPVTPSVASAWSFPPLYRPTPLSLLRGAWALVVLVSIALVVAVFIAQAPSLSARATLAWVVSLVLALWLLCAFVQRNLQAWELSAGLAALGAVWASVGAMALPQQWLEALLPGVPLLWLLKPLPMALALGALLLQPGAMGLAAVAALALLGDVLLMLPGDYFVPGLAAFLCAHLGYLRWLRRDAPWFASRTALVVCVLLGVAFVLLLAARVSDTGLLLAVAVYTLVLGLMGAQALGRAQWRGDASARWAAAGALLFMLSDSLIAINRFITPLAWESLWILSAYFAAQLLLLHHLLPTSGPALVSSPVPASAPLTP